MELIGQLARIMGILLLTGGAITAAYVLLFRKIEVKRVVTFAGILIVCGAFLLLYERVTLLELPGPLGKITVQAKADAEEIRSVRTQVEAQGKAVADIVEGLRQTADRVTALAEEVEAEITELRKTQIADRKRNLNDQLEAVNRELDELRKKSEGLGFHESSLLTGRRVNLRAKRRQLLEEIKRLEQPGAP